MAKEWWRINQTSRLIGEKQGIVVVETGGWFDVYFLRKHVTGTRHLIEAFKFIV